MQSCATSAEIAFAFSGLVIALEISEAMLFISFVPIPWVVTEGVPTLIPLVTDGASGSYGIEFLFKVIPAAPHLSSASLPVTPSARTSIKARR